MSFEHDSDPWRGGGSWRDDPWGDEPPPEDDTCWLAAQVDAEGIPLAPDGVGLILESDGMLCAFDAERLWRIDAHRRAALAEAGGLGRVAPEIVERSVRLELAAAMRVSEYTAGALMLRAEALLHRYPDVYDALSRGKVTPKHTEILHPALDELEPEDRDRVAGPALELAKILPVAEFRRRLRELIDTIRADTLTERHARALAQRRICVEDAADGMAWLHLYGPAVDVHAAHDRATRIGRTLITADRDRANTAADAEGDGTLRADDADHSTDPDDLENPSDPAGTIRTLDQARADVVCDLLIDGHVDDHPNTARGIRATVVVTVPALSLLDDTTAGTAPAVVDGIGPIPIHTARTLCGGGKDWMRVLTHPETGIVVSVGRDRYTPPAALRRLVKWRAARCMTPGCQTPANRCDVDHQDDWAHGGRTELSNLSPLCKSHHTLKGTGLWQVTQLDGGIIQWTSPTGRTYHVHPERHTPTFTPIHDHTPPPF